MAITYETQLYANNASSTLSASVNPTDVIIPLSDGSRFPAPSAGNHFLVTLDDGVNIEIVAVYGRSGNTLTGCVRGQEGTTARSFQAGTIAENRVTAGTIGQFLRASDRLTPLASLSELSNPSSSNNNSYVVAETGHDGIPLLVLVSSGKWRFPSYPLQVHSEASDVNGLTTSVAYTGNAQLQGRYSVKGLLIQFTSGANRGVCRFVSSVSANRISWLEDLPSAPALGDTYEVYQSLTARLNAIEQAL